MYLIPILLWQYWFFSVQLLLHHCQLHQLTLVCHLHVELILYVKLLVKLLHVPVWRVTLAVHQTVGQNVSLVQSVRVTWHVWERNVVTHVQDLVVQGHSVMSSIIHQYALVQPDSLGIPLQTVSQYRNHVSNQPSRHHLKKDNISFVTVFLFL